MWGMKDEGDAVSGATFTQSKIQDVATGLWTYTFEHTLTSDVTDLEVSFSFNKDTLDKSALSTNGAYLGTIHSAVISIPEPATFGLIGLAGAGLVAYRRRKQF